MNLALTDEQHTVREVFSALFAKESSPERVRAAEPVGHDPALWAHVVATGALGVGVPVSHGGAGAGLLELALIAEEAGRRLAAMPIAEPVAAARLLADCGASDLLEAVLAGTAMVSLAAGSGAVDGQLLNDGAIADVIVALDGDRIIAAHRPAQVRHVTNMGSLPLARWQQPSKVEVLSAGPDARRRFAQAVDEVRVLRGAALIGLAAEAIEIGAAYARERRAFGVPIGTYQAVAHPLADALVAKDGGQLLVWEACWALETGEPRGAALASMAFVFAAENAYEAAQHSLHIHGGYGFTAEYDIQLYYRRAKAWATAFADPRRELQVIGAQLFDHPHRAAPTARSREGMNFDEPDHVRAMRLEAEAFAAEHVTTELVEDELRNGDGVSRPLMQALGARGWIASTWPKEEGGAGLDQFEAAAILAAIRAFGGPTVGSGTTMLPANAIRALGSDALKKAILPGVAAGDTLVCLGYTEPEGGSDVFACKTRAVRDGDEWLINGQKMFTTFAHRADYCFLLTRSDPQSKGPHGLTMFVVPMDSPGIEKQAVRTMGYERTNIVFYNDVRVSDFYRIGEADQGLHVMRAALEAEQNVAPASRPAQLCAAAQVWARQTPDGDRGVMADDALVRERIALLAIDAEVTTLLGHRVAYLEQLGAKPGPHAALFGPEAYVRWSKEIIDMVGPSGMVDWTDPEAVNGGTFEYHYRSAVASTIYGGSSEVLRSIIAEQLLGLPRSRPKA
ncbi:MAG: hypothetical protein QOE63_315 [Acidimicrobiaceae bacterium]